MKALPLCLGNRHVDQLFHVFVSKVISFAIAQDRSTTTSIAKQHKILSKLLPKYLDLRRLHIKYTQCTFMMLLVPVRLQLLAVVVDCASASMLPSIPLGRLDAL